MQRPVEYLRVSFCKVVNVQTAFGQQLRTNPTFFGDRLNFERYVMAPVVDQVESDQRKPGCPIDSRGLLLLPQ